MIERKIQRHHKRSDRGLEAAIQAAGNLKTLSKIAGVSIVTCSNWQRVPPERVLRIERATGLSRYKMRPDVYGKGP